MTTIEQVKEFHDAFGVSADLEKRRYISGSLLKEELEEFMLAECDQERLDALVDLQYILDGTFIAYGWDKIKDAAFAEVHRSNMTKLQADGTPLLRADGKVLKGPNFEPPNLEQFL